MKIVEQTVNRLKLQHSPIAAWIGGGMVAIASLAGLVYLTGFHPLSATLTCQRNFSAPAICELYHFTLLGQMHSRKLYALDGAEVVTRQNSKGGPTYYTVLINGVERVTFLANPDMRRSEQDDAVARINAFIYNSKHLSLVVQQNGRRSFLLFGAMALFGLVGGTISTLTPKVICTFYKRLNKVVVEHQRWYGTHSAVDRPLNAILRVDLEEKRTKHGKTYRAVLVIAPAERIPLSRDYTKEKPVRSAIYRIQTFLDHKS